MKRSRQHLSPHDDFRDACGDLITRPNPANTAKEKLLDSNKPGLVPKPSANTREEFEPLDYGPNDPKRHGDHEIG